MGIDLCRHGLELFSQVSKGKTEYYLMQNRKAHLIRVEGICKKHRELFSGLRIDGLAENFAPDNIT